MEDNIISIIQNIHVSLLWTQTVLIGMVINNFYCSTINIKTNVKRIGYKNDNT